MANTESVLRGDLVVCTCGDQEYTARDVVEAALFRGELDQKWQEFLRRVAAEKRAEELDLELDEDAFDGAVETFRYERDLITAEETEQWLTARGLTLDSLSDYFARQYWGGAVTDKLEPQTTDYASTEMDLRDLFVVELILSGELERLTTRLSWRLAALGAEKDVDLELAAAEQNSFLKRNRLVAAQVPAWLEGLGRDKEWLDREAKMEAAYRRRCASLLVPEAFKKELAMLRLPLTRFETELIELESRDAAQEALMCVREDGMSMKEVAAEGRYPYRRAEFVLEDLADEMQQKFLSVSDGQVLEPMSRGDGFELCRVIQKIEPQANDPSIRLRVEQRLLGRHFSELAAKHVDRRFGPSVVPE